MHNTDELHIRHDLLEVIDDLLRHWDTQPPENVPASAVIACKALERWLPTRKAKKRNTGA